MISDGIYDNESLGVFAKNLRKNVLSSECNKESFLHGTIIDRNTGSLTENFTRKNISTDPMSVSNKSIHHGTELFLYLNTCPSSKDSEKEYWKNYYAYLFSDSLSSQQKVLSLLKIIKDRKSKDGQDIANKIMARLSTELGFRYYLPEILKKGIIREEVIWKNGIRNIKGTVKLKL